MATLRPAALAGIIGAVALCALSCGGNSLVDRGLSVQSATDGVQLGDDGVGVLPDLHADLHGHEEPTGRLHHRSRVRIGVQPA